VELTGSFQQNTKKTAHLGRKSRVSGSFFLGHEEIKGLFLVIVVGFAVRLGELVNEGTGLGAALRDSIGCAAHLSRQFRVGSRTILVAPPCIRMVLQVGFNQLLNVLRQVIILYLRGLNLIGHVRGSLQGINVIPVVGIIDIDII
jgi:hypothetical protein